MIFRTTILAIITVAALPATADTYLDCDTAAAKAALAIVDQTSRFDVTGGQTAAEIDIQERFAAATNGCISIDGVPTTGFVQGVVERDGVSIFMIELGDSRSALFINNIL